MGRSRHRVNFLDPVALLGQNFILVGAAGFNTWNEQLPDASCTHNPHRVRDAAPVVEVADHAHGFGVGRPNLERCSAADTHVALDREHVRTKSVPEFFVTAFGNQVQVELSDGWQVAIGVVGKPFGGLAILRISGFDSVVGHCFRIDETIPDAVPNVV